MSQSKENGPQQQIQISEIVKRVTERATNKLNIFFKLKIHDNGLISFDENYNPAPIQVSEHGISDEERQLYGVPHDYMVGETKADGSCFLNSFLIGLQYIGDFRNLSLAVLRAICASVGRDPPPWLSHALMYNHLSNKHNVETPPEFVDRVLSDDSWGEPEIEGRILCEYFSLSVYVLEANGKRLVTGEGVTSVIDVEFHRPKTLYFINRDRYHYEPLLPVNSTKTPTKTNPNINSNKKNEDGTKTSDFGQSESQTSDEQITNTNKTKSKLMNKKPQNKHVNIPKDSSTHFNSKTSESGTTPASTVNQSVSQNLDKSDQNVPENPDSITSELPDDTISSQPSNRSPKSSYSDHDIQTNPEYQQILDAIKAKVVSTLEAALNRHRSVLHIAPPDLCQMERSLHDALLTANIRILDLVYEHWVSAALTTPSHHIFNLKRLNKAMLAAKASCLEVFKTDKQILIAQHGLLTYNNFRIQLCRELITIKELSTDSYDQDDKKQLRKNFINILKVVLATYIEYTDNKFKLNIFEIMDESAYKSLTDNDTMYGKFILYDVFDLYYRKLDFFIAHIIFQYFHSIKLRQKLPQNAYQNIECALYYFIYRVNEDWRLYVPEEITKLKQVVFENMSEFHEFIIDPNRILNGLPNYMDSMKFKNTVIQFREKLDNSTVLKNTRGESSKLSADEVNSLALLPYLRDDYALKKVMKYFETCSRVLKSWPSKECLLIVPRVIQVTGEFMNNTADSLSLSPTTKALLYAHIPRNVLSQLHTLRDAKLIRKIDLEEANPELFLDAVKDLDEIKKAMIETNEIYKPIIEKSVISNSLTLVTSRINEIQDNFSLGKLVQELLSLDKEELSTIMRGENYYFLKQLPKYGMSYKSFSELLMLILNMKDLKRKLHSRKVNCIQNIVMKITKKLEFIENLLNDIERNIKSIIPNNNSSKKASKKQFKSQDKTTHNTTYSDWNTIYNLLKFFINEINNIIDDSKTENNLSLKLKEYFTGPPQLQNINNVRTLLTTLTQMSEEIAETYEINRSQTLEENKTYEYRRIKKLTELMSRKQFLTNKETDYLKENIATENKNNDESLKRPILEKILKNEEISINERDEILKDIDMNDKCKAIIENIVTGNKREECALQCLVIRVTALKNALGDNNLPQLVQRFREDEGFQMIAEALLIDIYKIYCDNGLKNLLDANTSKIITEYSLRHISEYFNPLLEVKVDSFDSNELPVALFHFALLVAEDEPVLKELLKMHDDGLRREEVKRKWSGPESPRLQHYFELLPTVELGDSSNATVESVLNTTNSANLVQEALTSASSNKIEKNSNSITSLETTASQFATSKPTATLSDLISSVSAAASAAAVAASAAASAARNAASAAEAAAEASAKLATLVTSANVTQM